MEKKRAASIYPTVDEINALPEKFRQYIHDLVTQCDKSGDVQTIAILRRIEMHCSSGCEVTASAVVAAVQAYSKINAAGQWIDRNEQVSLNDLLGD
jgi:hypothetical protein